MEIIEIGAVRLESGRGPTSGEFSKFVKPVASPFLSDFCVALTSIRQEDVDRADGFWTVFPDFLNWIGPGEFILGSWGGYDLNQFRVDCQRHGLGFPPAFERHLNLKKEFARLNGIKPCGMSRALGHAGLRLDGRHHRALDDARNIAKLAQLILPRLELDASNGFRNDDE